VSDTLLVFAEMICLQTEPIDCFDHGLEQKRESASQFFHLRIKWVLQDIIIDVSHQMNQTFLLYTLN
jgi:hypothetical protein